MGEAEHTPIGGILAAGTKKLRRKLRLKTR
jgi:hypothetical protein